LDRGPRTWSPSGKSRLHPSKLARMTRADGQ
jgi:hypothetical protein